MLCPISLSHDDRGYYINKKTLATISKLAKECSVLLDCTLLGIDNYIVRTSTLHTGLLRKEIAFSRTRGADLHNLDLESLAEGSMRENYVEMAKRIDEEASLLESVKTISIVTPQTNLTLPIQKGAQMVLAKGLITRDGDWHFLPAGIISLCINHVQVRGKIQLAGSAWGIDDLTHSPVILEADNDGVLSVSKSTKHFQNSALKQLLETPEGRYIGEVTFGFNKSALRNSNSPYEFYVADGNVTVALGANDHLGGQNPRLKERVRRVSNVHSHMLIHDATVYVDSGQGKTKLLQDGKWVIKK